MDIIDVTNIGIEAARAQLGELVANAQHGRAVTCLTRHDKPAAAVVPLNWINHLTRLTATETLSVRRIPTRFQEAMHVSTGPEVRIYVKGEAIVWGDSGRVVMEVTPQRVDGQVSEAAATEAHELLSRAVDLFTHLGWAVAEDHRTTDYLAGVEYVNVRYSLALPVPQRDEPSTTAKRPRA